ncbi:MAG: hypothetical protein GY811_27750 [Myxococcales bacterium]|nr:hypothetical protein [Myxococcales bacterium]
MLAHAMLLAPLVAIALTGCGSPGAAASDVNAPEDEASDYASERPERGRVKGKDDVSEKGKKWGGWRWKGERDNCVYVHDNQCFKEKTAACEAAGCGGSACLEKRGVPSKIKCRQDD